MGPDAIRTLMFDKMRDAMRDDINRAMEMVEPARQPPRLTRKQQEKAATMVEQPGASGGGAGEGGGGPAPMEEDTPPPEVGTGLSLCRLPGGTWEVKRCARTHGHNVGGLRLAGW